MNYINDIKNNYSIIEIAKRLGLKIDKNNKTLCPFHNDNNPSLSFNIKENYYHCFSCGAGGDNIKLVKEILNCNFNEAVEFIIGTKYFKTNNLYSLNSKNKIINHNYSNIYRTFINLLDNKEAIKYLEKRCITKKQIFNNNIKNIPKTKEEQSDIIKKLLNIYDKKDLIESGILSEKYNRLYLFHYKHRLIIPYFDINKKDINSIQGRTIDENIKPKYLFNRNAKDSIYNINKLNNIKDIIICEGVIDCLSLERLGYNSIALSGVTKTNILEQYDILKNYNIYSFADNDEAGKKLIKYIYKLDNYRGSFLINNFTNDNNIKDINELLVKSNIKMFKIQNIVYNYFEMPNNKICILDYYIFNKNELKYISKDTDFHKALLNLTIDKKNLSEKEYNLKYGELS